MKRLGILVLALAGLTALLGSCGGGGEEEAATLAVAFRLDEGSPVMVAYIGDPTEDPFQLPAGRYYIEALDGDDVLLSLGAVDIEDGDVVEFPPSFDAAGGVADPQQAEPLITLADFLVDVELARLTFWEIVTGGFTETPFDPAVKLDADAFQSLFEMYGEIAGQGDAVLEALDKIEGRAEVSSSASYVRSSWAPELDSLRTGRFRIFILLLHATTLTVMGVKARGAVGELHLDLVAAMILTVPDETGAEVHKGRKTPQKSEGLLDKKKNWEKYAKTLGDDLTGLEKKIKSDLKELLPGATSKQIDDWARSDLNEIRKALGKPSAPSTSPTRPMGAVSAYWQGMGCSESEVQEALDSLSGCLTSSTDVGSSFSQILSKCPIVAYQPDCVSEPTEEAEPSPSPSPSPWPTAEGREVTAVGQYVENIGSYDPASTPGAVVLRNTMTLTFNTAGGPVSGEGYTEVEAPAVDEECKGKTNIQSLAASYEGAYDPDLKKFGGVRHYDLEFLRHNSVFDEAAGVRVCEIHDLSGSFSTAWIAWLEDGVVTGWDESGWTFELTVQD